MSKLLKEETWGNISLIGIEKILFTEIKLRIVVTKAGKIITISISTLAPLVIRILSWRRDRWKATFARLRDRNFLLRSNYAFPVCSLKKPEGNRILRWRSRENLSRRGEGNTRRMIIAIYSPTFSCIIGFSVRWYTSSLRRNIFADSLVRQSDENIGVKRLAIERRAVVDVVIAARFLLCL